MRVCLDLSALITSAQFIALFAILYMLLKLAHKAGLGRRPEPPVDAG
jgi:hypothetical protein